MVDLKDPIHVVGSRITTAKGFSHEADQKAFRLFLFILVVRLSEGLLKVGFEERGVAGIERPFHLEAIHPDGGIPFGLVPDVSEVDARGDCIGLVFGDVEGDAVIREEGAILQLMKAGILKTAIHLEIADGSVSDATFEKVTKRRGLLSERGDKAEPVARPRIHIDST